MRKVLTIVRKEYLERVRSKSFVIGTVLGPALMSMFIVLPVMLSDSGADKQRVVGVIDPSGQWLPKLQQTLDDGGWQRLTLEPFAGGGDFTSAEADLKRAILEGRIDSGVAVGSDFIDSGEATFYSKSVSSLVMRDEALQPALNALLREGRFTLAAVPDSLFAFLSARTDWTTLTVTAEGGVRRQNEDVTLIMAVALIMILYIMVIMYGSHTLTAVIEEKSTRMAEVLLASVSPGNLMLGKVLGIGLAGLTQFAVWSGTFFVLSQRGLTVGDFSLDAHFLTPMILVSFVLFFLLGFFLYATLYAGIGAMCNTVQDSQQFHGPLMMGMVIPMMLLSVIMRAPDSTLAVVLSMVPLFAPMLMFIRVCVQTPPLWQIVLSWLLLGGAIWLSARMAGKLFRLGILMHGTAPTWASLARALRS